MSSSSMPVLALSLLGIIIAVVGLFVAGNIQVTIIGLVALGFAGLLQVLSERRSG